MTIFTKYAILDVRQGSQYASASFTFKVGNFAETKLGESRNQFLQMFGGTSRNGLLLLPKKVFM